MSVTKFPKKTWFMKFVDMYQKFWRPVPPKPPYKKHACCLGDPILRMKCEKVDPEKILTPEIQLVIQTMCKLIKKNDLMGLAAPQVGCALQIIAMELPTKALKYYPNSVIESRQIEVFPLKIFINPEMQVINKSVLQFRETCFSVRGFSGIVPRYAAVKLKGLNERGEPVEWIAKGWSARIAQHEMDHLNGQVFTDLMQQRSLEYDYWYYENVRPYHWFTRIKTQKK